MGATIYWAPSPRGEVLDVGLRSRFVTLMSEAFGSYPWTLTDYHVGALRGAAQDADDEGIQEALLALMRYIAQHGQITVWPEY
jgi:hypothetical protein